MCWLTVDWASGRHCGHVGAAAIGPALGEDAQDREAHRVSERPHHGGKIVVSHLHRQMTIEDWL